MKMIRPLTVTDAILTGSTIPEDDYPEWASGTTYAQGDKVILASTHSIYEALQATTGDDPSEDSSAFWLRTKATNRWRAFDEVMGEQATRAVSLAYTFEPGQYVSAVGFFELSATSLRVVMNDPTDGEVYNRTIGLVDTTDIVDWYAFLFGEITYKPEIIIDDLPPYSAASVTLTVSNPDGTAGVGQIVMGEGLTLGRTSPGTTVGGNDYSSIDRTDFGTASVTRRAYTRRVNYVFTLPSQDTNRVDGLISARRATPTVFYTDQGAEGLGTLIFGLARPLEIDLQSTPLARASLEVESLT